MNSAHGHESDQRLRVLRIVNLVSRSGRYGGPSDSALRQAEIASRAVTARFASGYLPDDCPDVPVTSVDACLFPVLPLVPRKPFPSAFSLTAVRTLWREIGACDLVHISIARELMPMLTLGMALARRKAVIAQPHGMLTSREGRVQSVLDLVVRPLVRRARIVLALTSAEAESLRRWLRASGPRIEILHNPIVSRSSGARVTPQVPGEALFLGRLHRRKRLDIFIAAAEQSMLKRTDIRWVVVGPDEGDLQAVLRAVDAGVIDHYEGPIPAREVADRVARCAVFVLTAENEAWGNVVAVALSLGRPVVVTASSAIAPLVERYGAGYVVSDGDAEATARSVDLAMSTTNYPRLASGARDLADAILSDEYQLRRLQDLYRSVATPPTRRRDGNGLG